MAHIGGTRPEGWRDRLWLLMTVAGVEPIVQISRDAMVEILAQAPQIDRRQ